MWHCNFDCDCPVDNVFQEGFKSGLEASAKLVRSQQGLVTEWDKVLVFPKSFSVVAEEILAIEVPND